jgi:hypothetical protein
MRSAMGSSAVPSQGQVGKSACQRRGLRGEVGDAGGLRQTWWYGDEESEFWQVASLWRREYRELRKPCLPCAAGVVAAARQE